MAEIINLKRRRKARARAAEAAEAEARRARFGRTRAERETDAVAGALRERTLDGARLDSDDVGPDEAG